MIVSSSSSHKSIFYGSIQKENLEGSKTMREPRMHEALRKVSKLIWQERVVTREGKR